MPTIKPTVYMSTLLDDLQKEITNPIYSMTLRIADGKFKEILEYAKSQKDERLLSILEPIMYI